MKRGSLKRRLVTAGAASILLALAVAGFGLLLLFERHVERRMTTELQTHLRQLVNGLDRGTDGSLNVAQPARGATLRGTAERPLLADHGRAAGACLAVAIIVGRRPGPAIGPSSGR